MFEKYESMTDEELVLLNRQGDEDVFEYLIEKYKHLVTVKARALFLLGGDNDDLVQEGMIGVFKAIRDYSGDRDASFKTFVSLCIERQMYDAVKKANRKKNLPLNSSVNLEEVPFTSDLSANPEEIFIARENSEHMLNLLKEKLSRLEQKVFNLYLDGMNYWEIAEHMNKSPKSIDNAMQRIKGKIKNIK